MSELEFLEKANREMFGVNQNMRNMVFSGKLSQQTVTENEAELLTWLKRMENLRIKIMKRIEQVRGEKQ